MDIDYNNALQAIIKTANSGRTLGGMFKMPIHFNFRIHKEHFYYDKREHGEYLVMDTIFFSPAGPVGKQYMRFYEEYRSDKISFYSNREEMEVNYYRLRYVFVLNLYKNDFYYGQWDHEFWGETCVHDDGTPFTNEEIFELFKKKYKKEL